MFDGVLNTLLYYTAISLKQYVEKAETAVAVFPIYSKNFKQMFRNNLRF